MRAADGADGTPAVNGIDYLEVGANQTTLRVHFIRPLPGEANGVPSTPTLTRDNISISGGVRIIGIEVVALSANDRILTVEVRAPGDFSTYTLRVVNSATDEKPPEGFDPRLAEIGFSFKIECPSEFDCTPGSGVARVATVEPQIDYLAKDYAGFRRLMLDRLSAVMPHWRERSPADLQMALVELLAYVGDSLSYYQDAVATEAYLGTARKRTSVRRHARLLDYFMHEGSNARAWVCVEVEEGGAADGATLPLGTQMLTPGRTPGAIVRPAELQAVLQQDLPETFETVTQVALRSAHNAIRFYTWSDRECCLPKGATRATLLDSIDASGTRALSLAKGDVLIFEEVASPVTGSNADADTMRRCAVRLTDVVREIDPLTGTAVVEITWEDDDALPFALCVSAIANDEHGQPLLVETSIARGNVVLVDHGATIQEVLPPVSTDRYRPFLQQAPLTFRAPPDLADSATALMTSDPRLARPVITLRGDAGTWYPQYDLLASDEFSREFVVEMQSDGRAQLRFGDGVSGRRPPLGTAFTATYRCGGGTRGNVGAEAIARVVSVHGGIVRVRNPLAAFGGADPETLEQVRQFAPQAFRRQERAVTEADYAEIATRNSDVQQAAATWRWTGSWYTAFVTVDRKGGKPVDSDFRGTMRDYLERYRVAGYDVAVDAPRFVPLDLVIEVCVDSGYLRGDVQRALLDAFSARDLPNGERGFFHPDNFTFGQPVYLSQIYRAAMRVAGVRHIDVTKLQRWGLPADGELASGVLTTASLEIVQLANDPNFPENGRVELIMRGGV